MISWILKEIDAMLTFWGRSINFCRTHAQFRMLNIERSISRVPSLIRVGFFGSSTFEDVDLLDVGGKAVEVFLSLALDAVVFK